MLSARHLPSLALALASLGGAAGVGAQAPILPSSDPQRVAARAAAIEPLAPSDAEPSTPEAGASIRAPSAPSAAADEEGRRLFVEGRRAYYDGRFRGALILFERSFELSGRAAILLAIGNAHDRLQEPEAALEALRRYLILEPEPEDRGYIEARLLFLEQEVIRRRAARAAIEDARERAPIAPPRARTFTWLTLGAGALFGLGAALSWSRASSRYDALLGTCATTPSGCASEDVQSLEGQVLLTNLALGLALSSAVAAAILFFVEGGAQGEEGSR
ncbi:MAG: hypothetical protein OEY14_00245 [Myxococcales bacterium]|nr:hypothetical protein [Myxococcales bacterium]